MKPINLPQVKLSMTMPSKVMLLSAAAVLAACSRNPQPGMDETGRADTTVTADTAIRARIDTTRTDTTTQVTPQVQPQPAPTPAPTPNYDTTGAKRDTSNVPSQLPPSDTTGNRGVSTDTTRSDSANVPHRANKFEGDSAMTEHNVPDSTAKSDSTGGR